MKSLILWMLFAFFGIVFVATWIMEGHCMTKKMSYMPTPAANLCLTSTPKRILEPWIRQNILDMQRLDGHQGVVLSLPRIFAKTGEPYVVPEELRRADQVRILECEDEGPGTKLLAPLRDSSIPEDRILVFCDDDMSYKQQTFLHLVRAIAEESTAVHTLCTRKVSGYIGFGAYKSTLRPILQTPMPAACRTVDDDYFTTLLKALGIPLRCVVLPNCSSICQACAYDMPTAVTRMFGDNESLMYKEMLTSSKRANAIKECVAAVQKIH